MVRATRAVRIAAGVTLVLAASLSFAADRQPAAPRPAAPGTPRKREAAPPARRAGKKPEEARLDAVKIVGAAERPAILFFLPRAKFRLLPMPPEPDPAARILQDDKLSADGPGS
ncbi:MAG: hypothetical protein ACM3NF_06765 [Gemmatimonadota bacterium]